MEAVIVFVFDFLLEVCAVYWLRSVTQDKIIAATCWTTFNVALSRVSNYIWVHDPALYGAAGGAGEICGTVAGMLLYRKRKDIRRIQRRARNWISHSLLHRPIEKRTRKKKDDVQTGLDSKPQ